MFLHVKILKEHIKLLIIILLQFSFTYLIFYSLILIYLIWTICISIVTYILIINGLGFSILSYNLNYIISMFSNILLNVHFKKRSKYIFPQPFNSLIKQKLEFILFYLKKL
jgi:hypothetical protein